MHEHVSVTPTFHAAGRLNEHVQALSGDGFDDLRVAKLPVNDSTLVDAIRTGSVAVAADGIALCSGEATDPRLFAIFGTVMAADAPQSHQRAHVTATMLTFLRLVRSDAALTEQLHQLFLNAATSTSPELRSFMLALESTVTPEV